MAEAQIPNRRLTKQEQQEWADRIFAILKQRPELSDKVLAKARAQVMEKIDRDG